MLRGKLWSVDLGQSNVGSTWMFSNITKHRKPNQWKGSGATLVVGTAFSSQRKARLATGKFYLRDRLDNTHGGRERICIILEKADELARMLGEGWRRKRRRYSCNVQTGLCIRNQSTTRRQIRILLCHCSHHLQEWRLQGEVESRLTVWCLLKDKSGSDSALRSNIGLTAVSDCS